jgi:hypothetical protein
LKQREKKARKPSKKFVRADQIAQPAAAAESK